VTALALRAHRLELPPALTRAAAASMVAVVATLVGASIGRGIPPTYIAVVALAPIFVLSPSVGLAYIVWDAWTLNRFSASVTPAVSATSAVGTLVLLQALAENVQHRAASSALPRRRAATLLIGTMVGLLVYVAFSGASYKGRVDPLVWNNLLFLLLMITVVKTRARIALLIVMGASAAMFLAISSYVEVARAGAIPHGGASAFYGNHVQPAFYTWLGILLLWVFLRRPDGSRRMLVAGLMVVLGGGVVLDESRGVFVVMFVLASLGLYRGTIHRLKGPGRVVSVGFLAFAAFVSVTSFVQAGNLPWNRSQDQFNAFLNGRLVLLKAGWRMFVARPITGWGFGAFRDMWTSYAQGFSVSDSLVAKELPTHSAYLNTAADLGILGVAAYVLLLALALFLLNRQRRAFMQLDRPFESRCAAAFELVVLSYAIHGLLDNSGWSEHVFVMAIGVSVVLERIRVRLVAEHPTRLTDPAAP
jgi:O-antigen ligase